MHFKFVHCWANSCCSLCPDDKLGRFILIAPISPHFWDSLPSLIVAFVAVFLGDFIGYWRHRLEHTRFLWPSHAVHHSDTAMTWLTLERFHPINRLSTFIIDNSVLILLGFPAYALLVNSVVKHSYGYLIHADLPWSYGRLDKVFVSPIMHRWHHSNDRAAYQTNFATVFSIFDRMFGTYRVPGLPDTSLGVDPTKEKVSSPSFYIRSSHLPMA